MVAAREGAQRSWSSLWREPRKLGLACVVVTLALLALWHAGMFYHDDAYITLRYVDRLWAGQGLTWTAGEPVEGFTHPAWLAQLVAMTAVGLDGEFATRALGVLYLFLTMALWWRERANVGPLVITLMVPGVAMWTVGGLETTGFVFWLLWAGVTFHGLLRNTTSSKGQHWLLGVALALATLHRPSGALVTAVACAVLFWRLGWRTALRVALVAGVPLLAYGLFRWLYYGDIQPNSAVAKLSGIPFSVQLESFAEYLRSTFFDWGPAAMWGIGVAVHGAWCERRIPWLVVFGLCTLVSVVLGGGDHMPGARMFVPLVWVCTFAAALEMRSRVISRWWWSAGALVFLWHGSHFAYERPGRDLAAAFGEPVGRFLEKHLPKGSVAAVATGGATPYFSPSIEYIDTLGLSDRHIASRPLPGAPTGWQVLPAHRKGDGAYVLARRPDVIILAGARGTPYPKEQTFLTDRELLASEQFKEEYESYLFRTDTPARGAKSARYAATEDVLPFILHLRKDSERVAGLRAQSLPVSKQRNVLEKLRKQIIRCGEETADVRFSWSLPPAFWLQLTVHARTGEQAFSRSLLVNEAVAELPVGQSYVWTVRAMMADRTWQIAKGTVLLREDCQVPLQHLTGRKLSSPVSTWAAGDTDSHEGWLTRSTDDEQEWRWATGQATYTWDQPRPESLRLVLEGLRWAEHARRIEVQLNGTRVAQIDREREVVVSQRTVRLPENVVRNGQNTLSLLSQTDAARKEPVFAIRSLAIERTWDAGRDGELVIAPEATAVFRLAGDDLRMEWAEVLPEEEQPRVELTTSAALGDAGASFSLEPTGGIVSLETGAPGAVVQLKNPHAFPVTLFEPTASVRKPQRLRAAVLVMPGLDVNAVSAARAPGMAALLRHATRYELREAEDVETTLFRRDGLGQALAGVLVRIGAFFHDTSHASRQPATGVSHWERFAEEDATERWAQSVALWFRRGDHQGASSFALLYSDALAKGRDVSAMDAALMQTFELLENGKEGTDYLFALVAPTATGTATVWLHWPGQRGSSTATQPVAASALGDAIGRAFDVPVRTNVLGREAVLSMAAPCRVLALFLQQETCRASWREALLRGGL